jgi:hypothetical protein
MRMCGEFYANTHSGMIHSLYGHDNKTGTSRKKYGHLRVAIFFVRYRLESYLTRLVLETDLDWETEFGAAGNQLANPVMGCILKGFKSQPKIPKVFRFVSVIRSIACR